MNKDTLVASILGLGLGLVAAIALWVVPKLLPKNTAPKNPQASAVVSEKKEETPSVSPAATESFTLNIADGTISKDDAIKIDGIAKDAAYVVISDTVDQEVVTPKSDGTYSTNIQLTEGGNDIVVESFSATKHEVKKTSVFYSQEDI